MVNLLEYILTNAGFFGIVSLISLIIGIFLILRKNKLLKIIGWLLTIIGALVILLFLFLTIVGPF